MSVKSYSTIGIESEVKERIDEIRDEQEFEPTYSELVDRALDAFEEQR